MSSYNFSPIHIQKYPYSFSIMEKDITSLLQLYPGMLRLGIYGYSHEGRALYDLTWGKEEAPVSLLVQAGIHGREWVNCLLLMMQICVLCQGTKAGFYYHGISYRKLFSQIQIHFLPMTNPDGVTISQYHIPLWKANARGVNLNLNFPSAFETVDSCALPHYKDYKGASPLCEPESIALAKLTKRLLPAAVIAYHQAGSLIYGNYGQQGALNVRCMRLVHFISAESSYPFDRMYAVSGGHSDWCVCQLKIPACTIETGRGKAPTGYDQLPSIWMQNRRVIPAAASCILSSAHDGIAFPVTAAP